MIHRENIKAFVQKTLGCGCPEEVFQYIESKSDIQMQAVLVKHKINIGNRLLIYIVEIHNSDTLKNIVTFLVDTGKKERDSLCFNRFRLVLATDTVDEITQVAEDFFKDINRDEKVHLHIVHRNSILNF
jgi:hypothetical protein